MWPHANNQKKKNLMMTASIKCVYGPCFAMYEKSGNRRYCWEKNEAFTAIEISKSEDINQGCFVQDLTISKPTYRIIISHVHTTIIHDILSSNAHEYTTASHLYRVNKRQKQSDLTSDVFISLA